MFAVEGHQARLMVPAESPHLPGGTAPHIRHREPRTCPPNPRRAWLQFRKRHGLGHVLQRDNAGFCEGCSEKIGGPNKTVEIDESMFGRPKYNRGHPVKGQWVFGGVERESGRTFLVPIPDRTADTLMTVINVWIEPGTSIISECWSAYRNFDAQGYTHRSVNHTIASSMMRGITPTTLSRSGFTSRRT